MGASPNMLAQIIQSLGAGPAAGAKTAAPGPGLSTLASELHGADPSLILRSLQLNKQQLSQLFVITSQQLPNISGHIAKAMMTLDRAIKEAQQAATTQSVVRGPVGFSPVAMPPQG